MVHASGYRWLLILMAQTNAGEKKTKISPEWVGAVQATNWHPTYQPRAELRTGMITSAFPLGMLLACSSRKAGQTPELSEGPT